MKRLEDLEYWEEEQIMNALQALLESEIDVSEVRREAIARRLWDGLLWDLSRILEGESE